MKLINNKYSILNFFKNEFTIKKKVKLKINKLNNNFDQSKKIKKSKFYWNMN